MKNRDGIGKVFIKKISAEETRELRQLILRPHEKTEELLYSGDEDKDTIHFGLFCCDELAGVASLYKAKFNGNSEPEAWKLRGMATSEKFRGRGFGKELMQTCIEYIKKNNGKLFWCYAREHVEKFYEKFGMKRTGEVFYPENLGSHVAMVMKL